LKDMDRIKKSEEGRKEQISDGKQSTVQVWMQN